MLRKLPILVVERIIMADETGAARDLRIACWPFLLGIGGQATSGNGAG